MTKQIESYSPFSLSLLGARQKLLGHIAVNGLSTVHRVTMRESHQHAQHYKTRYQRKASMTDERQRDPGHRQGSRNTSDINERLKTDECRKPYRAKLGEHVAAIQSRS